jgi:hypothetical protein
MNNKESRLFRYLLYFLHFFLSVNAVIGGFMLMLKPDGSLLELDIIWLDKSPFNNFFLPGFLLFTFIGLLSGITLYGLLAKTNLKLFNAINIYNDKYWAWTYSLYTGISTIIWITIQLILTHYFWLQPLIIFIALGIIICTLMPGVIKYYEINKI